MKIHVYHHFPQPDHDSKLNLIVDLIRRVDNKLDLLIDDPGVAMIELANKLKESKDQLKAVIEANKIS